MEYNLYKAYTQLAGSNLNELIHIEPGTTVITGPIKYNINKTKKIGSYKLEHLDTIGDGTCSLHAVLQLVVNLYHPKSVARKKVIGQRFRTKLATKIEENSELITRNTAYKTQEQVKNLITEVKDENMWLSDEIYDVIALLYPINILYLTSVNDNYIGRTITSHYKTDKTICICNTGVVNKASIKKTKEDKSEYIQEYSGIHFESVLVNERFIFSKKVAEEIVKIINQPHTAEEIKELRKEHEKTTQEQPPKDEVEQNFTQLPSPSVPPKDNTETSVESKRKVKFASQTYNIDYTLKNNTQPIQRSLSPRPVSPRTVSPIPVSPRTVSPRTVSPIPVSPRTVPSRPVSPRPVSSRLVSPRTVPSRPVSPRPVSPITVSPRPVSPKTVSPRSIIPTTQEQSFSTALVLNKETNFQKRTEELRQLVNKRKMKTTTKSNERKEKLKQLLNTIKNQNSIKSKDYDMIYELPRDDLKKLKNVLFMYMPTSF